MKYLCRGVNQLMDLGRQGGMGGGGGGGCFTTYKQRLLVILAGIGQTQHCTTVQQVGELQPPANPTVPPGRLWLHRKTAGWG